MAENGCVGRIASVVDWLGRHAVYLAAMGAVLQRRGPWASIWLALTAFALAARVLVPVGFMPTQTNGGFALAICTGHGPLIIGERQTPTAPNHKSTPDAPCAFAGSVTPTTPTLDAAPISSPLPAGQVVAQRQVADLIPGRGLAAPPPQSHAPPILAI